MATERQASEAADTRERLRLAIELIKGQGRSSSTDAEIETIARVLDEERGRCLDQLASLPSVDASILEAMAALEEPFRCLLLIRAFQGIDKIARMDGARLVLYAAKNLEELSTVPGRPGRLLSSILAGYVKNTAGADFLGRLPPNSPSSEVKPLVRYLIKAGTEEQKEPLRAALEAPGTKLGDYVVEGAVECLFGAPMVHRVRHQPTSIIYYGIIDQSVGFVKDGKRCSLSEFLEKSSVSRAKELQSLMDDLLFAENSDTRLLERIFEEESYSLGFGGEGDFINAVDMAYGDHPIVYFGGKGTGLLAFDTMDLSTARWDLGIEAPIRAIKASASGRLVAVGYENGSVVVFDASEGRILFKEGEVLSSVRRIIFSEDEGSVIAAGNREDDAIVMVDWATGEKGYLKGHGSYVNDLVLAPDGRYLYSGDNRPDGMDCVNYCGILRWDAYSLKSRPTVMQERAHRDSIRNIQLSESGKHVFSSSLDGQVRIWDSADGHLCLDFPKAEGKGQPLLFPKPRLPLLRDGRLGRGDNLLEHRAAPRRGALRYHRGADPADPALCDRPRRRYAARHREGPGRLQHPRQPHQDLSGHDRPDRRGIRPRIGSADRFVGYRAAPRADNAHPRVRARGQRAGEARPPRPGPRLACRTP